MPDHDVEAISVEAASTLDLLRASKLSDFIFYEETARRVESDPVSGDGHAPEIEASEFLSDDGATARLRFRLTLQTPDAWFRTDVAAQYSFEGLRFGDSTPEIRRDFLERVAFMATYPHLRASVFGAAGRLGVDRPVLSHVLQGEFHLRRQDSPE